MDEWGFAIGRPTATAIIKAQAEDFQVDEILGFDLTGDGDQLYIQLRKKNTDTPALIRALCAALGLASRDIGYAGLKDKHAVTTQWFSIPLPVLAKKGLTTVAEIEVRLSQIESPSIAVLQTQRNKRKLRRGSHQGNAFRLRLTAFRGCAEQLTTTLERIKEQGMPNYFGPQRFGWKQSNIQQASVYFESVAAQSKEGKARSTKPLKPKGLKNIMLVSAARSYLFNELLSQRISAGNWNQYLPGDVLNLDASRACFVLADSEQWGPQYQQRLGDLDIHPTGPMAGITKPKDRYLTKGQTAQLEQELLERFPLYQAGLKLLNIEAARRPLRANVGKLNWAFADNTLELSFCLGGGQYATTLLRELVNVNDNNPGS